MTRAVSNRGSTRVAGRPIGARGASMTVKVTLSIPDELAERIARHRDRVNPSATFAEAMRRELAALELTEDLGDLGATRARMRPERDAYENEPHSLGYRVGVAWARDAATYAQLKAF